MNKHDGIRFICLQRLYEWVSIGRKPRMDASIFYSRFLRRSSFFLFPRLPPMCSWSSVSDFDSGQGVSLCLYICSIGSVFRRDVWLHDRRQFYELVGKPIVEFYQGQAKFHEVELLYISNMETWAVFIAGFTPIPYKIFTIASGVFHCSLSIFVWRRLSAVSARFFCIYLLIWVLLAQHIKGLLTNILICWLFCSLLLWLAGLWWLK